MYQIKTNLLKFKKISARKPTDKIVKNGKYTLSNLKYLCKYGKLNLAEHALKYYFGNTPVSDIYTWGI